MVRLFAILSRIWHLRTNERITARHYWPNRTHLIYLKQTDLLKNKDILMYLDLVAREYGGEEVDKN